MNKEYNEIELEIERGGWCNCAVVEIKLPENFSKEAYEANFDPDFLPYETIMDIAKTGEKTGDFVSIEALNKENKEFIKNTIFSKEVVTGDFGSRDGLEGVTWNFETEIKVQEEKFNFFDLDNTAKEQIFNNMLEGEYACGFGTRDRVTCKYEIDKAGDGCLEYEIDGKEVSSDMYITSDGELYIKEDILPQIANSIELEESILESYKDVRENDLER